MTRISAAVIILIIILCAPITGGLAANQTVNVVVADTGSLTLSQSTMAFSFPSINTWTSDTFTLTSGSFFIYTQHTGANNPDIVVSSTVLQNGTAGPTIPLRDFRVYLRPQNGMESSGVLDGLVIFNNVGKGRKTATARYDLSINAAQQAGTYNGTVTYTLVNI